MFLSIAGFLPQPNEDDFVKFEFSVPKHMEPQILEIMGWSSLEDGISGDFEMTSEQRWRTSEILQNPELNNLTVVVGTSS